jgi:hypothetical protein
MVIMSKLLMIALLAACHLYKTVNENKFPILAASASELSRWALTDHAMNAKGPEQQRADLICAKLKFGGAEKFETRGIKTNERAFDLMTNDLGPNGTCFVPSILQTLKIFGAAIGEQLKADEPLAQFIQKGGANTPCDPATVQLAKSLGLVNTTDKKTGSLGTISNGSVFTRILCN